MSITDLAKEKIILIDWILKQEKTQNIKAVSQLIDKLDKEADHLSRTAGYRGKGIPVSMAQLQSNLKHALEQIQQGAFKTLDEVENESDKW
jgi:hypothetical protein